MTLRRMVVVTVWALSFLALALAFSIQASTATAAQVDDTMFEVAIAPAEHRDAPIEPAAIVVLPSPAPELLVDPTPAPPPAWIEIPSDLIATPTPVSETATPASLPMLTNIPATARDGSVVYLTFDDGPHPTYTNQVLDVLARYNAKATFFVLGHSVDAYPEIAQRITNEGHALGNHTYSHEALPLQTADHVRQTLEATNNSVARATGRTSSCMRPPYGSLDEATYNVITSQGYSVTMWDVDSNDWKLTDSYTIAAGVLRDTNLGDRVLFHDGPSNRAATVAALESVLSVLAERGVQFHALSC